jgi:DNA-binding transcriptional ArsR family regulator
MQAPLGWRQRANHFCLLRLLTEAGLVTREQRGKWACYRVMTEAVTALSDVLRIPGT